VSEAPHPTAWQGVQADALRGSCVGQSPAMGLLARGRGALAS